MSFWVRLRCCSYRKYTPRWNRCLNFLTSFSEKVYVSVNMKSLMYDQGFLLFTAWLWLAKHHTTLSSNAHTDAETHLHTSKHTQRQKHIIHWLLRNGMQRRDGWKAALSTTLVPFLLLSLHFPHFTLFSVLAWPSLYFPSSMPALHMFFPVPLFFQNPH